MTTKAPRPIAKLAQESTAIRNRGDEADETASPGTDSERAGTVALVCAEEGPEGARGGSADARAESEVAMTVGSSAKGRQCKPAVPPPPARTTCL